MALQRGDRGERIRSLQQSLRRAGFDPGPIDGSYGPGTEAAVLAFQQREDLVADGIAGVETLAALQEEVLPDDGRPDATPLFSVELTARLFPAATPRGNIAAHLPAVLEALRGRGLHDADMVLVALATIRAESESFEPIDEWISRYNTAPGGPPYGLYDQRTDLGNRGPTDGRDFRGRGFVQLTGRANYRQFGAQIGVDLEGHPERANEPALAARILAAFLQARERRIRGALLIDDLAEARRAVNGGTHGLASFTAAFRTGQRLIGALVPPAAAARPTPPPPLPMAAAVAAPPVPQALQVEAQIPACSTGLIQGLSQQVLEKLMQMRPGLLAPIDHPLIACSGSHNNAYLQREALADLIRAVESRGTTLRINSCLRTPMQQYLLHEQKRLGLCGIMAAAPPPHSNHNSGLAIDVEEAPAWRPALERHRWRWIGAFDPMHFDYSGGGVDLGALQVLAFQKLWNEHNPTQAIGEDGVWGPATAACVARSPAMGFGAAPLLARGMMSAEVGRLQLLLRRALKLSPEALPADGQYGPATAHAVAAFQRSQGLAADGQAGAATIRALERLSGTALLAG